VHPELAKLAKRSYDAVILCRPDFPFVQDGTRRDDAFRLEQHAWYQEQLRYFDCATLEAGGDIGERVLTAAKWISTLSLD
jgi:nicotinamide riboside kinase